jgi:hypothetical protein
MIGTLYKLIIASASGKNTSWKSMDPPGDPGFLEAFLYWPSQQCISHICRKKTQSNLVVQLMEPGLKNQCPSKTPPLNLNITFGVTKENQMNYFRFRETLKPLKQSFTKAARNGRHSIQIKKVSISCQKLAEWPPFLSRNPNS